MVDASMRLVGRLERAPATTLCCLHLIFVARCYA